MRKLPSRIGIGASSILLIIVVVCLTLFGVLSLVTARTEKALSSRTMDSVSSYYQADARAQETLAAIDNALHSGSGLPAGVTGSVENGLAFSIQTDDAHALNVFVSVENGRTRVTSYRYESTAPWDAGTAGGGSLWQGG